MAVKVKRNSIESKLYNVTFIYQPLIAGKMQVYLAGDFNDFRFNDIPMIEKNGIYSATIKLQEGKYAYKFIVDDQWLNDEGADEFVADGFGGFNSFVSVGDIESLNALYIKTFDYDSNDPNLKIYLAGDFNDWQGDKDKLTFLPKENKYSISVPMKLGRYRYKFVIDSQWIPDEKATQSEEDGLGGSNSIVSIDSNLPKYSPNYPPPYS